MVIRKQKECKGCGTTLNPFEEENEYCDDCVERGIPERDELGLW
jgi:hypothetical protein